MTIYAIANCEISRGYDLQLVISEFCDTQYGKYFQL